MLHKTNRNIRTKQITSIKKINWLVSPDTSSGKNKKTLCLLLKTSNVIEKAYLILNFE